MSKKAGARAYRGRREGRYKKKIETAKLLRSSKVSEQDVEYRMGLEEGKQELFRTAAGSEMVFRHEDIVGGIEARRVKELIDHGTLEAKHVYRVIPERTFSRRLARKEPLRTAEGDAIARLVRVTNAARTTFGDAEFADKWLNAANPALRDQVPIEMAATDAGAREVEAVLSRIAYGDYS